MPWVMLTWNLVTVFKVVKNSWYFLHEGDHKPWGVSDKSAVGTWACVRWLREGLRESWCYSGLAAFRKESKRAANPVISTSAAEEQRGLKLYWAGGGSLARKQETECLVIFSHLHSILASMLQQDYRRWQSVLRLSCSLRQSGLVRCCRCTALLLFKNTGAWLLGPHRLPSDSCEGCFSFLFTNRSFMHLNIHETYRCY